MEKFKVVGNRIISDDMVSQFESYEIQEVEMDISTFTIIQKYYSEKVSCTLFQNSSRVYDASEIMDKGCDLLMDINDYVRLFLSTSDGVALSLNSDSVVKDVYFIHYQKLCFIKRNSVTLLLLDGKEYVLDEDDYKFIKGRINVRKLSNISVKSNFVRPKIPDSNKFIALQIAYQMNKLGLKSKDVSELLGIEREHLKGLTSGSMEYTKEFINLLEKKLNFKINI